MASVVIVLPCADTGQADQVAAAIRDAESLDYEIEGGVTETIAIGSVSVRS